MLRSNKHRRWLWRRSSNAPDHRGGLEDRLACRQNRIVTGASTALDGGLEAPHAEYAGRQQSAVSRPLRRESDRRACVFRREDIGFPGLLPLLHEQRDNGAEVPPGSTKIDELREPLRPSDWRALKYPIIDLIRLGLRRISEDDLVGHVSRGTLFQTASGASRDQLLRLQGRA